MSDMLVGQWSDAKKALDGFDRKMKGVMRVVLTQEALLLRSLIVEGIISQAPGYQQFKPLSRWTLAARQFPKPGSRKFSGTKALIRSGELVRSVMMKIEDERAFVGVKRMTLSTGKDATNIAAVHEHGSKPIVIPFTNKMKAYLAILAKKAGFGIQPSKGRKGKATASRKVMIVIIPPRPFLEPSFKIWRVGQMQRVEKATTKELSRLTNGVIK